MIGEISYFLSKSTKLNLSSKFISFSVIFILLVVSGNDDLTTSCGTFVLNSSFFQSNLSLLLLKKRRRVKTLTRIGILMSNVSLFTVLSFTIGFHENEPLCMRVNNVVNNALPATEQMI